MVETTENTLIIMISASWGAPYSLPKLRDGIYGHVLPREYVAFQPLPSNVDDFEVSESVFTVLRVSKAISTEVIGIRLFASDFQ